MTHRTRLSSILGVVALVALIAASTALAAKPTRTALQPQPFVVPAGSGCSFDLDVRPGEGSRARLTEFSDGRTVLQGHGEASLTNLETGDTFFQKTRARVTDTFDPEANEIVERISGRIFLTFLPGDQGPFGVVGEDGAVVSVIGHQRLTLDPDTFAVTSYSVNGQVTDVCAVVSG